MNGPTWTLGAQQRLASAFTLFTTVGAFFWVFPKFGEGGLLWLFSLLPAAFFVFFSYYVIAPVTRGENDIRGASTFIVVVMWLIGRFIMNAALPVTGRSWTASTMAWLTSSWGFALIIAALAAALLRRIGRERTDESSTSTSANDVIRTGSDGHLPLASNVAAAARPAGGVPSSTPAPPQTRTVPNPSAPHPVSQQATAPSNRSTTAAETAHHSAHARKAPQHQPTPPRPSPMTAALTGASFPEVMTFLEVASSLDESGSETSLVLDLSPAGLTLSASGLEIGTVSGTWSGTRALRARLSAQEARRKLERFTPAPATLTVLLRLDGETVVEFRADHSVQRVSLEAARA